MIAKLLPPRVCLALFAAALFAAFGWFYAFLGTTVAQATSVHMASLTERADDLTCDGRPAAVPAPAAILTDETGAVASAENAAPAAARRKARVFGPYVLAIQDQLSDMLLGSQLAAEGVRAAADPAVDLAAVMRAVPSLLPAHGLITSGFGLRTSPFGERVEQHNGVDFAVAYGAPVYATADGVVTFAGWYPGLGKVVFINHGYGIETRYGHNSRLTTKVGAHIRRGDVIARAGSTGRSTGTHVHFEVRLSGRAVDPSRFLADLPDYAGEGGGSGAGVSLGMAVGGGEPED